MLLIRAVEEAETLAARVAPVVEEPFHHEAVLKLNVVDVAVFLCTNRNNTNVQSKLGKTFTQNEHFWNFIPVSNLSFLKGLSNISFIHCPSVYQKDLHFVRGIIFVTHLQFGRYVLF